MVMGSENLVSTRDGRNIRRSFDGFRLTSSIGDWTLDAFALKPVRDNPGIFDDPPSPESSFWGVYAVSPFPILPQGNVDLYYMGIENKVALFDGKGLGRERRQTIGTRLWGTAGPWDYNNELTFHFGRFGPDNILAWAVSTETAYKIASIPLRPRLVIRPVAYSSHQIPSSGTLGTFNPLFQKGPYFCYTEVCA